ncbi:MAG: FecR domain-containing protein [Nevskia sp.]|nr:FecR domain-containing protein [Nevskia sp.]
MNASKPQRFDTVHMAAAWEWVLRLQDEAVSQDDLAEWLRWYEADEQHKEAFDDMQSFWQQIDRVTEEPNPLSADLWLGPLAMSKATAAQLLAPEVEPGLGSRVKRVFSRLFPSPRVLSWAGPGLAFALCVAVALRLLQPTTHPVEVPATVPAPPIAQETTLPDGSHVELAPKTSVAVQYTDQQRLLDLQGGEAYFTVAHNRERPFIVQVGKLRVRAVGTAFNVRSAGERVVVTVAEGTVDVYPAVQSLKGQSPRSVIGPMVGAVRVTAGSEVAWTASGPVVALVNPANALGWREGQLEYLNEPLASAIADINRYSSRPIIIRDQAVGKIVFSGTVMTAATDNWIQSLPSLFPIELLHDESGDIVLVSRTSAD